MKGDLRQEKTTDEIIMNALEGFVKSYREAKEHFCYFERLGVIDSLEEFLNETTNHNKQQRDYYMSLFYKKVR